MPFAAPRAPVHSVSLIAPHTSVASWPRTADALAGGVHRWTDLPPTPEPVTPAATRLGAQTSAGPDATHGADRVPARRSPATDSSDNLRHSAVLPSSAARTHEDRGRDASPQAAGMGRALQRMSQRHTWPAFHVKQARPDVALRTPPPHPGMGHQHRPPAKEPDFAIRSRRSLSPGKATGAERRELRLERTQPLTERHQQELSTVVFTYSPTSEMFVSLGGS